MCIFYFFNSLTNGATYKEEDNVKSLYLNGSGAYATAPAVDFGLLSFTIASWVKLQSPIIDKEPLISDWSDQIKFLVYALEYGNVTFYCFNNLAEYKPWISVG